MSPQAFATDGAMTVIATSFREETCMRKVLVSALVAACLAGASFTTAGVAEAKDGRNRAAAAGAAAGFVGGALLGGALAGPRYAEPVYVEPEPVYIEPECYWRKRQVRNRYDSGWHWERVRVCR
jgi:hypothetical protein